MLRVEEFFYQRLRGRANRLLAAKEKEAAKRKQELIDKCESIIRWDPPWPSDCDEVARELLKRIRAS